MELQIYDSELNELGIVDMFKSLIWTGRFYEVGFFELQVPKTDNNIALLQKHRYVYRHDVGETGFIKSITEQEQDGESFMVVSGPMLEGLLDKRTITDQGHSTSLCETLKTYIQSPQGLYSFGYTGMSVEVSSEEDCDNWGGESAIGKNIGDYARALLKAENRAVRIDFRPEEHRMVCRFVKGVDRSAEQSENPHVIFSEEYGNICNTMYSYSEEGCYNLVKCRATYDDDVEVNPSKAYMLEAYLCGNDYSGGEVLGGLELTNFYTTTEAIVKEETRNVGGSSVIVKVIDYEQTYNKLLSVCRQYFCPYTENFEGTATGDGYRTKWQLGDYVTVEDVKRGTYYKKQVEEVTEVFEGDTRTVSPTFGANLKSIIDLIKGAGK